MKWDESIHANLSAETVPATESGANVMFVAGYLLFLKLRRTKSMHENGAAHSGGALIICYTSALFNTGVIVMLNAKFFEEMSSKLSDAVSNSPAKDFEKNARALLAQGFSKLDLVSREEYEVLAQRFEKLEARIAALEAQR